MVSAIPAVTSAPDRVAKPLDEVEEAMVEEEAPFLGAVLAKPSLRKSFSLKEKREFIRYVDAIVATGLSRRKACLQLGVPHGYYARFKKARQSHWRNLSRIWTPSCRTTSMVLHARFIQALQVYWIKSKMI
jgi:hypothetical protein